MTLLRRTYSRITGRSWHPYQFLRGGTRVDLRFIVFLPSGTFCLSSTSLRYSSRSWSVNLLKGFGPVLLTTTRGWYSFSMMALDAVTSSPCGPKQDKTTPFKHSYLSNNEKSIQVNQIQFLINDIKQSEYQWDTQHPNGFINVSNQSLR